MGFAPREIYKPVSRPVRSVNERRIEGLSCPPFEAGIVNDKVPREWCRWIVGVGVADSVGDRASDRAFRDPLLLQIRSQLRFGDIQIGGIAEKVREHLRQIGLGVIDLATSLDGASRQRA